MKRDEGGELRSPRWELEEGSFEEVPAVLAEGTITRAQAIKLGGAAILAGTGMLLFQSPADARKRHKKRRHRRKKKVTSTPDQVDFDQQPVGTPSTPQTVPVTNNQDTDPVYVSLSPEALNGGFEFANGFNPSLPILPGTTVDVPIKFTPTTPGVQTGQLVISDTPDATGNTLKVVDLTGTGVSASTYGHPDAAFRAGIYSGPGSSLLG